MVFMTNLTKLAKPFYECREDQVKFFANPDVPGAYHVFVGSEPLFYIPDRVLDDLASSRGSLDSFMRGLEAINPLIPEHLKTNNISFEGFYTHALKVRMKEVEEERDRFVDDNLKLKGLR